MNQYNIVRALGYNDYHLVTKCIKTIIKYSVVYSYNDITLLEGECFKKYVDILTKITNRTMYDTRIILAVNDNFELQWKCWRRHKNMIPYLLIFSGVRRAIRKDINSEHKKLVQKWFWSHVKRVLLRIVFINKWKLNSVYRLYST